MRAFRSPAMVYRITVEGLNLEKLLTTLHQKKIPMLDVKRATPRRMRLTCYEADVRAVCDYVNEKGWKLVSASPLYFSRVKAFLIRRWGIPLGLLLGAAALVAAMQFVWTIEIEGAQSYQADLRQALVENGIRPGVLKSAVNAGTLETILYRRYPKIAWFSVYMNGFSLVVDCTQGIPTPQEAAEDQRSLYASEDGVVVSVLVEAGTPKVKAGDIVRKGQLLIEGLEKAADEATAPVWAEGKVQARIWRQASVAVPCRETVSEPTGRTEKGIRLCTPWLCYPAQVEEPAYLTFDREILTTPVVGCFFPVWLEETVFHEAALSVRERDLAQVKAEAAAAALRALSKQTIQNEIVDKWVDYCMIKSGELTAIATAEALLDIARPDTARH